MFREKQALSREQFMGPFPKGCYEQPVSGILQIRLSLKNKKFDPEQFEKVLGPRETAARQSLEAIVRTTLLSPEKVTKNIHLEGGLTLRSTDPATGKSFLTLLAGGLRNIRDQKLVVLPSQRICVKSTQMKNVYALGGSYQLNVGVPQRQVLRVLKGSVIGIVLNTEHPLNDPLKDGEQRPIYPPQAVEIYNAVICAEQALLKIGTAIPEDNLTAQEFETAVRWLAGTPLKE